MVIYNIVCRRFCRGRLFRDFRLRQHLIHVFHRIAHLHGINRGIQHLHQNGSNHRYKNQIENKRSHKGLIIYGRTADPNTHRDDEQINSIECGGKGCSHEFLTQRVRNDSLGIISDRIVQTLERKGCLAERLNNSNPSDVLYGSIAHILQ